MAFDNARQSEIYPELYPELQEVARRRAIAPRPAGGGGGGTAASVCPPKPVFVDCPDPSTPDENLDQFAFKRWELNRPRHVPIINRIADRIVASQKSGQPIRTVLLTGHTDAVGSVDDNFRLGRQRAESVLLELCKTLEGRQKGLAAKLVFEISPCGERQLKASPGASRRVEVFLKTTGGGGGGGGKNKPIPPDHSFCGVPRKTVQREMSLEDEIRAIRRASRRQAVRPRICLFQNASNSSHRNHFECQAARWARRIAAFAEPNAAACNRRVGPTPYDAGADIIRSVQAASSCLKARVDTVHIFSHSGSYGVFGTTSGTVGLYNGTLDQSSRDLGGRVVADFPTAPLAQNVIVVLHGCNTAAGDDNIARALYQHLSASLRAPKVFGHFNSGCAGRDNSWREYSGRSPDGKRRHRTIPPHYQGNGCCS